MNGRFSQKYRHKFSFSLATEDLILLNLLQGLSSKVPSFFHSGLSIKCVRGDTPFFLFWTVYISVWNKTLQMPARSLLSCPCVLRGKNKRAVVGTAPSSLRPPLQFTNFLKTCINKSCPSLWKTGLIVTGNSKEESFCVTPCHHEQTHKHTARLVSVCRWADWGEVRWFAGWSIRFEGSSKAGWQ